MKLSSNNIYKILIFVLIAVDVFLVLYSCQKHSQTYPPFADLPDLENLTISETGTPIYVYDAIDNDILSGIGTIGIHFASLDTEKMTGELSSLRTGKALGDPFLVDITNYLTVNPCDNCFKIESVSLSDRNELLVTFSLRHPFPLPANKPPDYRERLDLHVFDVRAIFFLKQNGASKVSFNGIKNAILNPIGGSWTLDSDNSGFWASEDWDGATDLFDDFVDSFWHTDSDIHPYKVFFENSQRGNVDINSATGFTDPYKPVGHNVFPQGSEKDFQTINFGNIPQREYDFVILLAAAYGQSAKFWGSESGQRGSPRYYLPEFNCKEPWKVKVNIPPETDLLSAGDTSSSMVVNVDVYDWQHSYGTVRGDYDPKTAPFDSLRRSSRVKGVYVDIPGVNNLDYSLTPISGTGYGSEPLRYSLTINNDKAASQGLYPGLVAVVDELHGTNLPNYGVQRDGVTLFDVKSFVTYAQFTASVVNRGGSFGVGMNISRTGTVTYSGLEVKLDSLSADNMIVDDNIVHIVASIYEGPGGDGWDIYYFRSINHGLTFEPPIILNRDWKDGTLGDQVEPSLAIAPNAERLYFIFTDKSHLRPNIKNDAVLMRYSTNHGLNFSSPASVLSLLDCPCDQPSIAAGPQGFVWVAFRKICSYSDNSIILKTSTNYGENFIQSNVINVGSYEIQSPLILSNLSISNPYMMAIIYAQKSTYAPDLKFVLSLDGGGYLNLPKNMSFENYHEYVSLPRVDHDLTGNIYCAYRVNYFWNPPSKVMVSYGKFNVLDYIFVNAGNINTLTSIIGDLDIYVSHNNNVYLTWNQDDESSQSIEHDIIIYKNPNGVDGIFSLLGIIPEPSEYSVSQEMPRLGGNPQGELFLLYKDSTYSAGGDIFLTRSTDN